MNEEQEITLGAALGMLFDAVLEQTGNCGTVGRTPSPTGEQYIGWRQGWVVKDHVIEAPIKLPMWPSRVKVAIDSIVEQVKARDAKVVA